MAVDASAPPLAHSRVRAIGAPAMLGVLVGVSFLARLVVVWRHETPVLFPDEYIYTELSRSFAAHGLPLIRGGSAHFPSVLAPLLTAPAWLVSDVGTAYRLVQAVQALAMSSVAVPVFLLGRYLRLPSWASVAAAALALAVPDFLYASYVVSEPFAYPLTVGAVAAGVAALAEPTRKRQALFLVLAALAAAARIQFVVVPAAFVLAALILGLRERRLRRVLAEQKALLALFALGAAGVLAVGVGYYSTVWDGAPLGAALRSGADNLLVLVYAAGWLIVPGAVLGIGLGLARPRDRRELAFAAMTVAFGAGVLGQAALYGSAMHERYVFYVVPLLALAFLAYVRRGWPYRLYHGLGAGALAAAATVVPLSTLAFRGEGNTPILVAVHWLQVHVGSSTTASTIVLWAAIAGAAALAVSTLRPRAATALALVFAGAVGVGAWYASAAFDNANAANVRRHMLPADRSWVDARGLGRVTLVQAFGGQRTDALDQLFWNRSVDRVALLPGSTGIDAFRSAHVSIGADGSMTAAGKPLSGPLLVDRWGSTLALRGVRRLAGTRGYDLLETSGPPRVVYYFAGRFFDGWAAPSARLAVYGAHGRTIRFTVTLPPGARPATLTVALPGGERRFSLAAGRPQTVSLPVCSSGPWKADLSFSAFGFVGSRAVSARTSVPRLAPGAACPAA
jgi:hypothetical protein